jgi:hypothetical protein
VLQLRIMLMYFYCNMTLFCSFKVWLFGSSDIFSIFSESSSHVSESDALSNQRTRII